MTDLRQAAKAVVDRWDSPAWEWRDQGPTADLMADLRKALAQPEQQAEPTQWRDMVVVTLVREGINKHRARELADHFASQPEQEPVAISTDCVFPEWKPSNSDFKHWCYQYFGADSDEKYLAEAVLMLPRKQTLPMKAADEFELHRLLAEERYTVRQLSRALREQVESPTFMGEPLITHTTPPASQPEQEPLGWLDGNDKLAQFMHRDLKADHDKRGSATPREYTIPVYTAPPQRPWQGLTDAEKKTLATAAGCTKDDDGHIVTEIFRLAEAALKELNT